MDGAFFSVAHRHYAEHLGWSRGFTVPITSHAFNSSARYAWRIPLAARRGRAVSRDQPDLTPADGPRNSTLPVHNVHLIPTMALAESPVVETPQPKRKGPHDTSIGDP
jgi:hypothetical protein